MIQDTLFFAPCLRVLLTRNLDFEGKEKKMQNYPDPNNRNNYNYQQPPQGQNYQQQPYQQQPYQQPYPYPGQPAPPQKKMGALGVVLIVLLCIFLLIAGGIGACFCAARSYYNNLSDEYGGYMDEYGELQDQFDSYGEQDGFGGGNTPNNPNIPDGPASTKYYYTSNEIPEYDILELVEGIIFMQAVPFDSYSGSLADRIRSDKVLLYNAINTLIVIDARGDLEGYAAPAALATDVDLRLHRLFGIEVSQVPRDDRPQYNQDNNIYLLPSVGFPDTSYSQNMNISRSGDSVTARFSLYSVTDYVDESYTGEYEMTLKVINEQGVYFLRLAEIKSV